MTYAGDIVDNVLRAARRTTSATDKAYVWRAINKFYFQLAEQQSWAALRERALIDMSSSGTTGALLPSHLVGIDRVRDQTDKFEFFPRDSYDIAPDEYGYRYETKMAGQEPYVRVTDGSVATESTTFASATIGTTDYTGEYVMFGREPGVYEVTAVNTFSPKYYGPALTDTTIVIRPAKTKRILLYDPSENVLTDRSVYVHYWRLPIPLYQDSDAVVLPTGRPLELMVLIDLLGTVLKRQIATDRYRNELREAMDEEVRLNPTFSRSSSPRDKHGSLFSLSTNYFGSRDSGVGGDDSLREVLR